MQIRRSPHPFSRRAKRLASIAGFALFAGLGCDTVDLGGHFEPPDLAVDENLFHCEIQPHVLTEYRCAGGKEGEEGGCHTARSALRLIEVQDRARCRDGRVIGAPPEASQVNLERVRAALGTDAESSPLYRRPLGLDSHPRVIFAEDSEAAALIRGWLDRETR